MNAALIANAPTKGCTSASSARGERLRLRSTSSPRKSPAHAAPRPRVNRARVRVRSALGEEVILRFPQHPYLVHARVALVVDDDVVLAARMKHSRYLS